ncbi:MAG: sugar transferase [Anaerolineales bacterium]|nr:sugar transferase [Anaerolineales bacterium]
MADVYHPSLRLRPSEQRFILLFGDLVASVCALFGSLYVWREYNRFVLLAGGFTENQIRRFQLGIEVPLWFYFLPLIWLILLVESYEIHTAANWKRTLCSVAVAPLIGLALYSVLFIFNQEPNALPRIGVGAFLVIATVLTLILRALYIRLYTSSGLMRRFVVMGAGRGGRSLVDIYSKLNPPPFLLLGYIDDDLAKQGKAYNGLAVLGASDKLLNLIDDLRISDLVIAVNGEIKGETFQTILDAQERGVEITRMPILYEEMTQRVPVEHLESDWVIRSFVDQIRVRGMYELFKRIMDILGGIIGALILVLVFPFVATAIVLESGFPIFYSQKRLGKGASVFTIYKFRTMYQDAEANGEVKTATENDPRVTRVGNFLRKTRLDEMPQFLSVIRGEMSLVGPRAERPELVSQYQKQIPFYRARLLVKPGLTGWAQINYGYVATIKETFVKLEYDLYYIKHRTLNLDFSIILRTVGTVLRRTGR